MSKTILCSYCKGPINEENYLEELVDEITYTVNEQLYVPLGHENCQSKAKDIFLSQDGNCPTCNKSIITQIYNTPPKFYIDNMKSIYCTPLCYYNREIHEKVTASSGD